MHNFIAGKEELLNILEKEDENVPFPSDYFRVEMLPEDIQDDIYDQEDSLDFRYGYLSAKIVLDFFKKGKEELPHYPYTADNLIKDLREVTVDCMKGLLKEELCKDLNALDVDFDMDFSMVEESFNFGLGMGFAMIGSSIMGKTCALFEQEEIVPMYS